MTSISESSGTAPTPALRTRGQPRVPWKRLGRMTVLALGYLVLEIVGKLMVAVQIVFVLWQRAPHAGMQRFAAAYSRWMGDLWAYVTYASDFAPWPFARWPRDGVNDEVSDLPAREQARGQ